MGASASLCGELFDLPHINKEYHTNMSFSDITILPKKDETRPLVVLLYGVVWFIAILSIAWMGVGFNADAHLVDNGRVVQFCSTDQPGCSDTPTGNYLKEAIGFDEWATGIIVGIATILYLVETFDNKREQDQIHKQWDEFYAIYSELKTTMVKMINGVILSNKDIKTSLNKIGLSTPEDIERFAAEAAAYLLGERVNVTVDTKNLAKKIYALPNNIKPLAAALRDSKYENYSELIDKEWKNSRAAGWLEALITEEDKSIKKDKDYIEYMNNFSKLKF